MRNLFAFIPATLLLVSAPSAAQEADPHRQTEAAAQVPENEENRLENLFSELKRARNEKAAERIANRIAQVWAKSGSASIDLMMEWAQKAMQERKFAVALDFLDQITVLQPGFAEGWNRRATVHFMMDNYAKSMRDIERTLQLEPRHFGALTGMATIMKNTGHKQLALDAYQRALEVYPMLRSAQNEASTLEEELAGEGI